MTIHGGSRWIGLVTWLAVALALLNCGGGRDTESTEPTHQVPSENRYEELVRLYEQSRFRALFDSKGNGEMVWARDGVRWRIDDMVFHEDLIVGTTFVDDGTGISGCIWSVNTRTDTARTLCGDGPGGFFADPYLKNLPPIDEAQYTGTESHGGLESECFAIVSHFSSATGEICFSQGGIPLRSEVHVHGREFEFVAESVDLAPATLSFASMIDRSRWEEVKDIDLPITALTLPDTPKFRQLIAEARSTRSSQ